MTVRGTGSDWKRRTEVREVMALMASMPQSTSSLPGSSCHQDQGGKVIDAMAHDGGNEAVRQHEEYAEIATHDPGHERVRAAGKVHQTETDAGRDQGCRRSEPSAESDLKYAAEQDFFAESGHQ